MLLQVTSPQQCKHGVNLYLNLVTLHADPYSRDMELPADAAFHHYTGGHLGCFQAQPAATPSHDTATMERNPLSCNPELPVLFDYANLSCPFSNANLG